MISPWGYLVSWVGQWDMQNMSLSAILTGGCTPDPRRRYPVGRVGRGLQNMSLSAILTGGCTPGPPQAISCGQSRLGIAEYVLINYSDRGLHPRTPAGDILWAVLTADCDDSCAAPIAPWDATVL